MKGKELEQGWHGMSEEILAGVAAWRAGHPKATLREIEAVIDKRLSELRAQMISDTANASASAAWESALGVDCPECGAKLMKKGKKKRSLLTKEGRVIELERDYGVCPACGQGIFPPG